MDTQTWSTWENSLNIPREGPGLIQFNQFLFAIGGRGANVNGSIEVWNLEQENQCWRILPHLKVKHSNQEYQLALWQSQA